MGENYIQWLISKYVSDNSINSIAIKQSDLKTVDITSHAHSQVRQLKGRNESWWFGREKEDLQLRRRYSSCILWKPVRTPMYGNAIVILLWVLSRK